MLFHGEATSFMDVFQSDAVHWIVFSLGITNLLLGVTIFFSCRVIPGAKLAGNLMKHEAYRSFYRYHPVLWQVFWVSVVVHLILGTLHGGLPFVK